MITFFFCSWANRSSFCYQTRVTVLLDREAKRRRKTGEDLNCYGPNELKEHRFAFKEVITIMSRPFVMFGEPPCLPAF